MIYIAKKLKLWSKIKICMHEWIMDLYQTISNSLPSLQLWNSILSSKHETINSPLSSSLKAITTRSPTSPNNALCNKVKNKK